MKRRYSALGLAASLLVLAACGAPGQSAQGCNAFAKMQAKPSAADAPIDHTGIYSGTVGGKPGFLVVQSNGDAQSWFITALTQRGGDASGFVGGGKATEEKVVSFDGGLPHGGGQFFEQGLLSGPNQGVALLAVNWTVDDKISGKVRRLADDASLLDYDLKFDDVTFGAQPADGAIPAGQYDILYDGADIGDFTVPAPGSGTGTVTWPGAAKACPIGVSQGVRAPKTERNAWRVQFNTDLACSPAVWSVGYAAVAPDGGLTFELIGSRQAALHRAPTPAGQQDAMHLQLKCRR